MDNAVESQKIKVSVKFDEDSHVSLCRVTLDDADNGFLDTRWVADGDGFTVVVPTPALRSYPKEPDAQIVRFTLRFPPKKRWFEYAALRPAGKNRWFTTGSSCPKVGFSWHELIDFIRAAELDGNVMAMSATTHYTVMSSEDFLPF